MCSYASIISPIVLLKQQSSSSECVGKAKKKDEWEKLEEKEQSPPQAEKLGFRVFPFRGTESGVQNRNWMTVHRHHYREEIDICPARMVYISRLNTVNK